MPVRNHKRQGTGGGSHGDDTDSDGASLAGPQPYGGDKQKFPRCVAGSLRVWVGSSNATLGGNPIVGFHVPQGVEEVSVGAREDGTSLGYVQSERFRYV